MSSTDVNMSNQDDQYSSAIKDVIQANRLTYRLPSDLSCVQQRRMTRNPFLRNSYSDGNTQMTCILQTGSSFVGDANLHFKVNVDNATGGANSTCLSGTDFLSSLTIYSRGGVELSRTNNLNVVSRLMTRYKSSKDKMNTKNQTFYFDQPTNFAVNDKEFTIPLSAISGLFATSKTHLLPSNLCAGMRLEFVLTPATIALNSNAGNVTYTVSDVYIDTMSYTLNDAISLKLNEISATQSLEIPFVEVYTSRIATPGTDCSIEVRKAASRALGLLLVPQINPEAVNADSSGAEPNFPITQAQSRLGSIYMPANVSTSKQELYLGVHKVFEQSFPEYDASSVSLSEYLTGGLGVYGCSLERSSVLDLTGMSSNNSRVVSTNLKFTSQDEGRSVLAVFFYLRVCKLYLNNELIEE